MKSPTPVGISGSGLQDQSRHCFRPMLVKLETEGVYRHKWHRALLEAHRERFAGTEILQRLPSQEQRKALLVALHREPR